MYFNIILNIWNKSYIFEIYLKMTETLALWSIYADPPTTDIQAGFIPSINLAPNTTISECGNIWTLCKNSLQKCSTKKIAKKVLCLSSEIHLGWNRQINFFFSKLWLEWSVVHRERVGFNPFSPQWNTQSRCTSPESRTSSSSIMIIISTNIVIIHDHGWVAAFSVLWNRIVE